MAKVLDVLCKFLTKTSPKRPGWKYQDNQNRRVLQRYLALADKLSAELYFYNNFIFEIYSTLNMFFGQIG